MKRGRNAGSRGFGMIEVMVASAILVIVFLAISEFVTRTKKTSSVGEFEEQCRDRAQFVVSAFKNFDNKIQIDNWHSLNGQPAPSPSLVSHPERYMFPVVQNVPGSNLTFDRTNSWQQINSGTNWALALYNHPTQNFCTPPRAAPIGSQLLNPRAPVGGFAAWGPGNTAYPPGAPIGSSGSEKIYLNVQRVDLATNAVDCNYQKQLRIVPLSSVNANFGGPPPFPVLGSKMGLQITATVQYTDRDGIARGCEATATLRPDGDNAPPGFVVPPADVIPGFCPGPSSNCSCNSFNVCTWIAAPGTVNPGPPPVICDNTTVSVGLASTEPGTVFACELDSAPANALLPINPTPLFQPCSSFTSGSVTGKVTKIHTTAPNNVTGVQVDLTGLTTGYYVLFVEAFDSAQNPSPPVYTRFYYTPSCAGASPSPSPLVSPSPSPSPSPGLSPIPSPTANPNCTTMCTATRCGPGAGACFMSSCMQNAGSCPLQIGNFQFQFTLPVTGGWVCCCLEQPCFGGNCSRGSCP